MSDIKKTLLDIVNHILNQHPELAPQVEQISAYIQGKGYGAATVEYECEMVKQLLAVEPKVVIDIGGNVGNYAAEIRRKYPLAEIHVFEPSAVNVKQLSERFISDNRVKVVPYAVSDETGSGVLFSNDTGSVLGSLTQRKLDHFNISFNVKENVNTLRFEEYWEKNLPGKYLDIVKIDVEGHELSVLKGFGNAILFSRVIQFEFGGTNIDTRTFFQDFWYFFKEQKFDLFRISPVGLQQMIGYDESDENFLIANYIAVNKNLL